MNTRHEDRKPDKLLAGGDYARSGSSTTYVTLGHLPDWPVAAPERVLTWSQCAPPSILTAPAYGAVERHGRRSGGLGATFTPVPGSSEIVVSVPIALPSSRSARVPGLVPEFAEAVIQGFQKFSPSSLLAGLGAGRLEVHPAWWHEIDSEASGFVELAANLIGVLRLPVEASGEEVWACWRDQKEAAEFAPMLGWLRSTLERRPEVAHFRPAALPTEIAALEASLGFPLPELLRRTLLCVNGGMFAGQPPATDTSCQRPRYALLSVEEIESAYFNLAAAQHPFSDATSTSEPGRPLFRLTDDTLVLWPFVPIARDLDNDSLLVLEVLPVPYSNRIQLAVPGLNWTDWPVLYRRYLEFIENFLGGDDNQKGKGRR